MRPNNKVKHASISCKLQNLTPTSNTSTTLFHLTREIILFDYNITLPPQIRRAFETKSHQSFKNQLELSNTSLCSTNFSYYPNHLILTILLTSSLYILSMNHHSLLSHHKSLQKRHQPQG